MILLNGTSLVKQQFVHSRWILLITALLISPMSFADQQRFCFDGTYYHEASRSICRSLEKIHCKVGRGYDLCEKDNGNVFSQVKSVPVPQRRPQRASLISNFMRTKNDSSPLTKIIAIPTPRPNRQDESSAPAVNSQAQQQPDRENLSPAQADQPVRAARVKTQETINGLSLANIPIPTRRPQPQPVRPLSQRSDRTAPPAPDASSEGLGICDYPQNTYKQKNCEKVVSEVNKGRLPKGPVMYALKALKERSGQMCDGKKITNSCTVFVTNLDQRVKGYSNRSPAYFFNLCVGDKSKTMFKDVINKTFTNRGTGSRKGRYIDLPGMKTTLPGVFVANRLTAFHPYYKSRKKYAHRLGYRRNHSKCKGVGSRKNNFLRGCPVLRLRMTRLGGAATDAVKPMHTSPFRSSSGCPSLRPEDNWMMRAMAAKGNSLYVAYTKSKNYKSKFVNRCSKPKHNQNEPVGGVLATR